LIAHGANPARTARLPIPVDTCRFSPAVEPAAPLVLGFAARFEDPRKNLDLLLAALAQLRQGGVAAVLRLAGADPSIVTRAKVAALGLRSAVSFVGELPLDALPDFYRGLDLMVLPSHQEGLCIAGIEAMASGVPVVSTRCGGPEDYVVDGETGLLCGWAPEDMAAVIARVVGDRALRDRLGAGARRMAETVYAPEAFAAGLAEAWRNVWGEAP
jgi:glycosyltransferase involved in cell wall biosynthesis